MRARWDHNRKRIVAGIVAAALGAGLFAFTGHAPDPPASAAEVAVEATPATGYLHVAGESEDDFTPLLGKHCNLRRVPVLALAHTASHYDVVTDPAGIDPDCKTQRLEVSEEDGEITGRPLPPFEQPE